MNTNAFNPQYTINGLDPESNHQFNPLKHESNHHQFNPLMHESNHHQFNLLRHESNHHQFTPMRHELNHHQFIPLRHELNHHQFNPLNHGSNLQPSYNFRTLSQFQNITIHIPISNHIQFHAWPIFYKTIIKILNGIFKQFINTCN